MKISPNSLCPCGSKLKYKKCCKIYHIGTSASNALYLMKSRYSAFVVGDSKYIIKTTHNDNVDFTNDKESWTKSILEFSNNSDFKRLEIKEFIDGESEAYVTFKAIIFQNLNDVSFTEKSKFIKVNNCWLYHSGEFIDDWNFRKTI